MAKFCTLATNVLKFRSIGSDGVAFVVGVSGFECAASVGRVYTESIGAEVNCDLGVLPLPPFNCIPQSTREGFLLPSSMAHRQHMILGHPAAPQDLLLVLPSIPPEAVVEPVHPK